MPISFLIKRGKRLPIRLKIGAITADIHNGWLGHPGHGRCNRGNILAAGGGDDVVIKGISPISGRQMEYPTEGARGAGSSNMQKGQSPRVNGNLQGAGEGSAEEIFDAVSHLNAAVDVFNKGLHFRIHEDTERVIVEVINKDSGEVIRQIPPEYILDVLAKIDALLGVFVDEKI